MTIRIYDHLLHNERPVRICSVDGCDRKHFGRGWCSSHYTQWYTTGVAPTIPFTDQARFNKYVDRRGPDECWPWLSTVKKSGYGQFWFQGKPDRAHKVSYLFAKGDIPAGLLIRHTCDNKVCVNPSHLILGTPADNSRDARERGQVRKGSLNGRAKLNESQVADIRARRRAGETYVSLAERFGVSRGTIYWIVSGKHWVGVGEEQ